MYRWADWARDGQRVGLRRLYRVRPSVDGRMFINTREGVDMKKCDICGGPILPDPISGWDLGHNAEPVREGRCCDSCNDGIIIPARLAQLFGKKEVDNQPQVSV